MKIKTVDSEMHGFSLLKLLFPASASGTYTRSYFLHFFNSIPIPASRCTFVYSLALVLQ